MLLFLRSVPVYRFFSHPPSPSLLLLSLHPLTSPDTIQANLTTLTFSPFFPCCVSICLRPRLFLLFLLLPSLPFFPPSPFPSQLCCTTLPSSVLLRPRLSPLHLCPPLGFPFYQLYCSHPSLFRSPTTLLSFTLMSLSHSFNVSRILFLLQRERTTNGSIWENGSMEKGRENERRLHIDFSILSLTLAYVKSPLGSIKASFFKLF